MIFQNIDEIIDWVPGKILPANLTAYITNQIHFNFLTMPEFWEVTCPADEFVHYFWKSLVARKNNDEFASPIPYGSTGFPIYESVLNSLIEQGIWT